MDTIQQKLSLMHGNWLAVNCGNVPDSKCHLVMMAPGSERSELVEAAMEHVTKHHGHKDTKEMRSKLSKSIGTITI